MAKKKTPVRRARRTTPARRPGGTHRQLNARARRRAGSGEAREIDAIRVQIEQAAQRTGPPRWNANPEDVQRSVIQLVLTLVEFVRRLLERQAIRRMEQRTLSSTEIENIGTALMRLEDTIRDIAAQFDIPPEDLNLDLGSVGKLM